MCKTKFSDKKIQHCQFTTFSLKVQMGALSYLVPIYSIKERYSTICVFNLCFNLRNTPIELICGRGVIQGVKHVLGKRWAYLCRGAYRWRNMVCYGTY